MLRTNYCGDVSIAMVGEKISLCGWVKRRRDHGTVIFIDLRDNSGVVQLVTSQKNVGVFSVANKVRAEYVLRVDGEVRMRHKGAENLNISNGEIEVDVHSLIILNTAESPAFLPENSESVSEEIRLRHRLLELRGEKCRKI